MDAVRARWLLCILAAAASGQEGEGAPGKGEDPLAPLLKQLADPEAKVRAKAARALGRVKSERAIEAERVALADPDETVRAAAAVALVRLEAPEARVVDILAAALRNPDWYTRWEACVVLGSVGRGAAAAVPALLAAADDQELDLGREAAIALTRIAPGDPQMLSGLVRLLESDRDIDRAFLLRALDAAGQIALTRDWLAKEMVANRHGMRTRASVLLEKCGLEGAAVLADALKDPDPRVRAIAIRRLAGFKDLGAAPFADALKDEASDVRIAAIEVLVARKAGDAAPGIAELLADKDAGVRLEAARALAELKVPVPGAGAALVRLAGEGDEDMANAARSALRVTGFDGLAECLEGRFEAAQPPAEAVWVWAVRLRPCGGTAARAASLDLLAVELEDKEHGAALAAALKETLAKDQDAILLDLLAGDDDGLRRAAATLLGHLARDREPCVLALNRALRDKHPDVRAAAEAALKRLRP